MLPKKELYALPLLRLVKSSEIGEDARRKQRCPVLVDHHSSGFFTVDVSTESQPLKFTLRT